MRNYKIHQRYLSKLKFPVIVIYFLIVPLIQVPYWCFEQTQQISFLETFLFTCESDEHYTAPNSDLVNVNPLFCFAIDLICLAYFIFFRIFKSTWAVQTKQDKHRIAGFFLIVTVQLSIFIIGFFSISLALFGDLLRPIVCMNFMSQLRFNLFETARDLKASITILFSIFSWIFFFALVGFYMFRNSFEGVQ